MPSILTSLTKWQFLPTLEDINNDELNNLAERLKGDSEKETLTNILEWQDKNIQFWWERWLIPLLVLFSLLIIVAGSLLLLFFPIFGFLPIFWGLGASTFSLVYLCIRYRIFLEKKNIKVVIDTFWPRLTVDKILEYKLAKCIDYAKLTASLLFKIYPDSELYFITIRKHVAVGIKIENKCYVLDQHLPILSKDTWLKMWEKKTDVYSSKLISDSRGKPIDVTFNDYKSEKKRKKSKVDPHEINTEKLTEEIAKILGIKQSLHMDNPDLEIPLSNYAAYYDDDEIIKHSLIRAIKNRLESEFCGNMDKLSKIAITQNEKDLTVTVSI